MGFGVFGFDAVLVLGETEGREIIFERRDAVQAPGCVGERLDEMPFEDAFRLQVVEELLGEAV